MQHGLLDSAGTFLFNEPELSPAYTLAKQGYDMWFGNSRGTVNSLGHVNMTYHQAEYWNFTFEQMGRYDVPANLDYILNFTGVEKVFYLGHSQGTIQFWIANMFDDTIGTKVEKMVAFAPVMYEKYQNSILITASIKQGTDLFVPNHFTKILVLVPSTFMGWFVDTVGPTAL